MNKQAILSHNELEVMRYAAGKGNIRLYNLNKLSAKNARNLSAALYSMKRDVEITDDLCVRVHFSKQR